MDYSLPGSSIHGIFQARVLEWGAIAFSELVRHQTLRVVKIWEAKELELVGLIIDCKADAQGEVKFEIHFPVLEQ